MTQKALNQRTHWNREMADMVAAAVAATAAAATPAPAAAPDAVAIAANAVAGVCNRTLEQQSQPPMFSTWDMRAASIFHIPP